MVVTGCTHEAATPDATAHISDNSLCEYALVQGCTDMAACVTMMLQPSKIMVLGTHAAEGFVSRWQLPEGTFTLSTYKKYILIMDGLIH